jgi:hypothetical protein
MRLTLTAIVSKDPCFEFGCAQQPVWFRYGTLPMNPCRFNRVEPRTFARQVADDDAYALTTPLHPLIVWAYPVPYGLAAGPRGVIPDQQQRREAWGGERWRAPRQKIDRDRADGAPCHTPEPQLRSLLQRRPHQQAITGQRLGIGLGRRRGQLLELGRGLRVCPTMLVGLGQPTPPDFIAKPQGPRRLGPGPLDQPVAPFCFRAYAGSGLVIHCLARFHATRTRRRATRMASSLTSRGVSPWAKLTSAANASVHRLVGLPNVRGLWCNSARRDSQTPGVKIADVVCGRDDCGWSPAGPRWWNA